MSGVHTIENTNFTPPPTNEELLKRIEELEARVKELKELYKNLEPLRKFSRLIGFFFGNASNDTQENSKDAPKEEAFKQLQEENASLKKDLEDAEKGLGDLKQSNSGELEALRNEKEKLTEKITELSTAKDELTKEKNDLSDRFIASQKQIKLLENDKQVLNNEKIELSNDITKLTAEKDDLLKTKENLTKENENLNTDLSNAKNEASQTSQKLKDLEQKHAPYDKLEKLYEVFLEVKECLIFEFVKDTHSAMDLIGHVLSDSKYYVEEFYKKTQQELKNKNSDKGEKLVALFDLLFECIKDKKFKRLEAPSSYNSACITLYPEQSSTGNIQRVVLRGYSYNDAIKPSIVDMGG